MKNSASFRDPSGFIFTEKGKLLRQVNLAYQDQYDQLISSGLFQKLVSARLLISHEDVDHKGLDPKICYRVIQPQVVDFISYPYEWSFHQLKDAALATLRIQRKALEHGMTLKDASAYNIQFVHGSPILIDTLSFEIYKEGMYWDAYGQFCRHFLAPMALMSYSDVRLSQLLRIWIDGIPLDLAAHILPVSARLNAGVQSHIFLHAAAQSKYSNQQNSITKRKLSKTTLEGLVYSLEQTIRKLEWKPNKSEWGEYYSFTNYSEKAFSEKKKIIENWIRNAKPANVWDLGGNTGDFSRIASEAGIPAICFDVDPVAVDKNYLAVKAGGETNMLPLLMDLTNPSGGIGWANEERESLEKRGPAGMVLALALIHHLAISNNLPLGSIAEYFKRLGKWLVIEFVPKSDSQVIILLANRKDIFPQYSEEGFETAFSQFFEIIEKEKVSDSDRVLYLLKAK